MKMNTILATGILFVAGSAMAQSIPVTGTVTDIAMGTYQVDVEVCRGGSAAGGCPVALMGYCERTEVNVAPDGFFSFFIGDGTPQNCPDFPQPFAIPANANVYLNIDSTVFGPFDMGSAPLFGGLPAENFARDSNRIFVNGGGGPIDDRRAIDDAIRRVGAANVERPNPNPKVIELGAGVHDWGDMPVNLPSGVSLIGQGPNLTVIRANGLGVSGSVVRGFRILNSDAATQLKVSCQVEPVTISDIDIQTESQTVSTLIEIAGACNNTNSQIFIENIRANYQGGASDVVGLLLSAHNNGVTGVPVVTLNNAFLRVLANSDSGRSLVISPSEDSSVDFRVSNLVVSNGFGTTPAVVNSGDRQVYIRNAVQETGDTFVGGSASNLTTIFSSAVSPSLPGKASCIASVAFQGGRPLDADCQ